MDLESVCVHLVKEAVDLCECVCNWQVEELGKVLQTQPVSLQLSGSSGLLLQHFVCSSCSQPVNTQRTRGNTKKSNHAAMYQLFILLTTSVTYCVWAQSFVNFTLCVCIYCIHILLSIQVLEPSHTGSRWSVFLIYFIV